METITLTATRRDVLGKQVKKYRNEGKSPAVLYGVGLESVPLLLDTKNFLGVYSKAGATTLLDVVVDGQAAVKALVSDVAVHPVTSRLMHVDLRRVDMKKKISAKVPLHFVGESPAVKTLGGIFVGQLDEVEIECLPSELIHEIEVDISSLATFEDVLHVSDLKVGEAVTINAASDLIVALVQEPRSEEELKSLNETVVMDVTQVAKVEKEKKEEEPAEEESK